MGFPYQRRVSEYRTLCLSPEVAATHAHGVRSLELWARSLQVEEVGASQAS